MNQQDFWRIVDSTRGQPDRAEVLAQGLAQLADEEIVQFRILYDDMIHQANKFDLWGAAHLINGGCTEDEFYLFREGLLELGQKVFDEAVADADSLAKIAKVGERLEGTEGLGNAAGMAWVAKRGTSEEEFFEEVDRVDANTVRGDADEGEWWDFKRAEEASHRLPRLAERFLKHEAE